MKVAAYFDLVNMILWLMSMVWCCASGRGKSRFVPATKHREPKAKMAEASFVQQEPDLKKRWSRPPSYSSLADSKSKTLVDKTEQRELEKNRMEKTRILADREHN
jgi:hypothetical protein